LRDVHFRDAAEQVLLAQTVFAGGRQAQQVGRGEEQDVCTARHWFCFCGPLGTLPKKRGTSRKKQRGCLSPQGELPRFPTCAALFREPSEGGQRLAVAFLLLTFLWRSKEK
jgi:hypothetical protein